MINVPSGSITAMISKMQARAAAAQPICSANQQQALRLGSCCSLSLTACLVSCHCCLGHSIQALYALFVTMNTVNDLGS